MAEDGMVHDGDIDIDHHRAADGEVVGRDRFGVQYHFGVPDHSGVHQLAFFVLLVVLI